MYKTALSQYSFQNHIRMCCNGNEQQQREEGVYTDVIDFTGTDESKVDYYIIENVGDSD